MALRLTVPAGIANPHQRPETRPKQLKEWLNSLPLIKIFESARAVCDELARLNRFHLTADERLSLLELYEPTLKQLRVEIAEDYNKAPLPLPATSRQAVNLARELFIEEAYGYKLALLEKTSKLMLFSSRKQLVPLIEQLMRTLSGSLTLSYQSYLPTPAGVWHEMHELYRYASQQKLMETEKGEVASQIDCIYKHAVLMALTDPYRLPRAELLEVMHTTLQVASLTELRLTQEPGGIQLFVILPDSDKPPKRALQYGVDWEQRGSEWYVGTGQIVNRLTQAVKERGLNQSKDSLQNVPIELLHRLIECWGAPSKRIFRRQTSQITTVHVCTGINRICKILESVMSVRSSAGNSVSISNPDSLQEWDVINQSAGGLKLRGMPVADTDINVGDVIAVQYRGVPVFSIGAVRWAQTFEDGSVELGVQMLAPRAEVASLVPTIGNHSPRQVLLLPEIPTLQQPASIIAYPGSFQQNREFILTYQEQTKMIRSNELTEKTVYYELLRFLT